jgi:hypothetical protein
MSVKEHLRIFTLVDLQARKTFRSRTGRKSRFKADFSVLAGHKKTLSGPHVARGPLFAHPLSRQCELLNISQPYRPPRIVIGIALLYFTFFYFLKL